MSDKITITVWLSGRGYKLKIDPQKEQAIRTASKIAEQKMTEIKMHLQGKDEQDFLALCLLMYVTDQVADNIDFNITQETTIKEIIDQIDDVLPEKSS